MAKRIPPLENERSTPELLRAIATDTGELVRKEVQLAKQEIVETIPTMIRAVAGIVVAGALGLVALIMLALAVRDALVRHMAAWAADLIATGILMIFAGIGAMQVKGLGQVAHAPEETKRTIKEDVAWAKRQLKR